MFEIDLQDERQRQWFTSLAQRAVSFAFNYLAGLCEAREGEHSYHGETLIVKTGDPLSFRLLLNNNLDAEDGAVIVHIPRQHLGVLRSARMLMWWEAMMIENARHVIDWMAKRLGRQRAIWLRLSGRFADISIDDWAAGEIVYHLSVENGEVKLISIDPAWYDPARSQSAANPHRAIEAWVKAQGFEVERIDDGGAAGCYHVVTKTRTACGVVECDVTLNDSGTIDTPPALLRQQYGALQRAVAIWDEKSLRKQEGIALHGRDEAGAPPANKARQYLAAALNAVLGGDEARHRWLMARYGVSSVKALSDADVSALYTLLRPTYQRGQGWRVDSAALEQLAAR